MKWPSAPDDAPLSFAFGDSRIGNLPAWTRHLIWWTLTLILLTGAYFDTEAIGATGDDPGWSALTLVAAIGVIGLLFLAIEIIRGMGAVPLWQSLSRVLVSILFLIGLLTLLLSGANASAFPCRHDTCPTAPSAVSGNTSSPSAGSISGSTERATPRDLIELLAWNAFDVVPAVDLAEGIEWPRPATSDDPLVRSAAFTVRVFTVVIVVGALGQLWKIAGSRLGKPLTFGDFRAGRTGAPPARR